MPAALKEQFHSVYSTHTEGQTAPFLPRVWCPWCLFDFCMPDRDEWGISGVFHHYQHNKEPDGIKIKTF